MSLSARQLLTKALHLLDRGEVERGELVLRDAIALAGEAADSITAVAALCCLGELLVQLDRRSEATEVLRSCLAVPISEDFDDVCAVERTRAQEILAALA
jgi:hypothetical protein